MPNARLPGLATAAGTASFAREHPAADGHWRLARRLTVSSLGLGSYLGDVSPEANALYEDAARAAIQGGLNVLDAAINYRHQQSERDLGRALARAGGREGVVVTTKGGYIPHDAGSSLRADAYIRQTFAEPGILRSGDVVGGMHSLAPRFVEKLLDMSLENLGLEGVDVYYLHNPETQLAAGVPRPEFAKRMTDAFEVLERACDAGRVGAYGVATWDGLRVPPGQRSHLVLADLLVWATAARERVGGHAHHFGAIQLPVNLAMPEAATVASQVANGRPSTVLQAATDAGLYVQASASMLQARLVGRVPPVIREALGAPDDVVAAIDFARGVPGVTTALVGMGRPEHARANAAAATTRPSRPGVVAEILSHTA